MKITNIAWPRCGFDRNITMCRTFDMLHLKMRSHQLWSLDLIMMMKYYKPNMFKLRSPSKLRIGRLANRSIGTRPWIWWRFKTWKSRLITWEMYWEVELKPTKAREEYHHKLIRWCNYPLRRRPSAYLKTIYVCLNRGQQHNPDQGQGQNQPGKISSKSIKINAKPRGLHLKLWVPLKEDRFADSKCLDQICLEIAA